MTHESERAPAQRRIIAQLSGLLAVRETLEHTEFTVEAADGMIAATVNAAGQPSGLVIDPRVHRKLGSEQLCEAIVAAMVEAARAAGIRTRELLQEAVGAEVDLDGLLSADNLRSELARHGDAATDVGAGESERGDGR